MLGTSGCVIYIATCSAKNHSSLKIYSLDREGT
jgi:hypothetical protein